MAAVLSDPEHVPPPSWAAAALALLLIAMGGFIAGIGFGWVDCDPASLRAPRWVIGICGGVFALGGMGVLATALGRGSRLAATLAPVVGFGVLAGLVVVCHWIAFADGDRRFTAQSYESGLRVERHAVDERTARAAFAFAALSLDLMLVIVAGRAFRK